MDLLDLIEEANARATDPQTSWDAARSVRVLDHQAKVLSVIKDIGPCSDEQLVDACRERFTISPSGVRTRRHELADKGLVIEAGEGKTVSGRACLLWDAAL